MPAVRETTAGDELFRLPLSEFTAARNALAAKLKKEGDSEESERIKALPKPPVSAWVANQLYWKHRSAFDRLLAAGEQFRNAQAAQLAGKSADLRGPLDARREALGELTKIAAAILHEGGHPSSPEVMRRIMTTLEALATYGTHSGAPPAGRLTADIDPPGFEALAMLMADVEKSPRSAPVIPPRRAHPSTDDKVDEALAARIGAANASLAEAQRELKQARDRHQALESSLKQAAMEAKEAETRKHEAEERFQKAIAFAAETAQRVRDLETDEREAAQAVENATRTLEMASTELRTLLSYES